MDFAILLYVQPLARNLLARAVLDSVTQNRKMMGKVRRTKRAQKVNEMVAMICERGERIGLIRLGRALGAVLV